MGDGVERRVGEPPGGRPGVVGEAGRRAVARARHDRERLIVRLRGIALVFNLGQAFVEPGDDVVATFVLTAVFAADFGACAVLVRRRPALAGLLGMALDVAVCGLVLLNNRHDPSDPVYLIGIFVALEAALRWGRHGGWGGGIAVGAGVGLWAWDVVVRTGGASFEHVTFRAVVVAVVGGITGSLVHRLEVERWHLAELAYTDPLTGLANRQALREVLDGVLARGERVAAVVVDLDGFKEVNDRFGHLAGDEVLVAVAERMRAVVREHDVVARLGGDEFVVVAVGRDEDVSTELAARLCQVIGAPLVVQGEVVPVTAACGGVAAGPGDTADLLLRRADDAMYVAKRATR